MRIKIIKEPKSLSRPAWIPALISNLNIRFGESTSSRELLMEAIPEAIRNFEYLRRNRKVQLSGIVRVETDNEKSLIWVIYISKDSPVLTFEIN